MYFRTFVMTKRAETHEESASYSYIYIFFFHTLIVSAALKEVLLNFCVPLCTLSSHNVLLEC